MGACVMPAVARRSMAVMGRYECVQLCKLLMMKVTLSDIISGWTRRLTKPIRVGGASPVLSNIDAGTIDFWHKRPPWAGTTRRMGPDAPLAAPCTFAASRASVDVFVASRAVFIFRFATVCAAQCPESAMLLGGM